MKEESLERNRGKTDNTIPCNSSFSIIFVDLLHVNQYRRHRVLKNVHMHNCLCPPKAITGKILLWFMIIPMSVSCKYK